MLVAASLVVALDHHRNPTLRSGIWLGLLTGLGTLTRSEIGAVHPAVRAALGDRLPAAWASGLAGARRRSPSGLATLVPWSVYNAGRFREPVLLSTNDGNTLLGANCDDDLLRRHRRVGHHLPRAARDGRPRARARRAGRVRAIEGPSDRRRRLHQGPPRPAAGRHAGAARAPRRRLRVRLAHPPRCRRGEGGVGRVGRHRVLVAARDPGGARLVDDCGRTPVAGALVARSCRSRPCWRRRSCSTGRTASGPRPSRRSCILAAVAVVWLFEQRGRAPAAPRSV